MINLIQALLAVAGYKRPIRAKTRDATFTFRMGAGFAGDVNRTHPADIEPALVDAGGAGITPDAYGQAVLVSAANAGVRKVANPADVALSNGIYGITVRPYPFQQATTAVNYGGIALNTSAGIMPNVIDVLKSGYIMVVVKGADVPAKGGLVYIWTAAAGGGINPGDIVAGANGGSAVALDNKSYFNGPPDANSIAEVAFNL